MHREVKQVSLLPGFVQRKTSGDVCWVLNCKSLFRFSLQEQDSVNRLQDKFMGVPQLNLSCSFVFPFFFLRTQHDDYYVHIKQINKVLLAPK
jgi:hypothetical protein